MRALNWVTRPALYRWLAVGASVVLFGACGEPEKGPSDGATSIGARPPSAEVVATDDAGREVRLPRPARRVVSLVPSVTETLIALGARDRLVGRTDYDDAPEVRDLPSVGGGIDPSVETLVALRPELVVAWAASGGSELVPRLENLGIPVFTVATEDTAGVYANIRRLGHLLGHDPAADSLSARIRAGLRSVRASVVNRPEPTVLYLVGEDPPRVAGPRTFIAQLIDIAGGQNVFPDLTAHWPQVSMEAIVRRQPDRVLVAVWDTVSEAGAGELLRGPGWSELRAVRCGRVAVVDANVLNRPGPRIVESARTLRDAIHAPGSGECGL